MLNIAAEKMNPIYRINIDTPALDWQKYIKEEIPFLFLEENDQIYAYVETVGLKETVSLDDLKEKAVSLDLVGVLKNSESISLPFIFQTLGDPITLIKEDGAFTGYIRREDLLVELLRQEGTNTNLVKVMLASIPMGVFVVDNNRQIVSGNEAGLQMMKQSAEKVLHQDAGEVFHEKSIEYVFSTAKALLNQIHIKDDLGVLLDYSPLLDGDVEGVMVIVQDLPKVEEMAMEIEYVKDLNTDLNAILASLYDEIVVVDHQGNILRSSENFLSSTEGTLPEEVVGKNIFDLEDVIGSSVVRLVMEKRKKASIVQETLAGKNVMATGNPVFNEEGQLYRIVIALRDITETTKLKGELDATKQLTKEYKKELDTLKNKEEFGKEVIYRSEKMNKVMLQIEKLAEFHSTVMILGESGVGKDLISKMIHHHGKRSEKPYLALNCGAIPEDLLESELFGYVKGAFTGADQEGKMGYFEQANGGVLFLDEISELPPRLQVKLLRVLQEQEITPVGSTKTIPVDVQIITASNKDMEKLVQEDKFREDLFYRIHVIPIMIPSLRERPEDIPLLAYHFIEQMNEKYGKQYHLAPEAVNVLEAYSWPGNIRELQNVIERIIVFADEEILTADFVSPFMHFDQKRSSKPMISEVMPLKEAKEMMEEQLIKLAIEKFGTTTKAAKALQINQSTVSRKYKKTLQEKW